MLLLRNGRVLDRMHHVSDHSDQARTVRTAVCGLNECAPCACSQQEKQARLDLMTAAVTPVRYCAGMWHSHFNMYQPIKSILCCTTCGPCKARLERDMFHALQAEVLSSEHRPPPERGAPAMHAAQSAA